MKTFRQLRESMTPHTSHPYHSAVTQSGYNHVRSSSAANTTTHEYQHPKGHTVQLHTNAKGQHSFDSTSKSGKKESGQNVNLLHGAMIRQGL